MAGVAASQERDSPNNAENPLGELAPNCIICCTVGHFKNEYILVLILMCTACGSSDASPATAKKSAHDAGHSDASSSKTKHSGVWAMMGYDAKNNYFNPDEHTLNADNAGTLEEKWRFMVGGFPAGAPAIANGTVFVTATGGTYALRLDTGEMIWNRDDIAGTASPAYRDGALYVHAQDASLYRLDAKDGSTVWGPVRTYALKPCDGTSSPILAKDKVLVGHSCGVAEVTSGSADQVVARGGVEAFSLDDGSNVWTYYTVPESGENGAMVWSSVAIDLEAGVVFAGTGNNYTMSGEHSDAIHAIDLATGERKWFQQVRTGDTWSFTNPTTGPDFDFGANPILAEVDGKKIVADGDKGGTFWALDRETGQILWSRTDLSSSHNQTNGGVLNNGGFDGKHFYVVSNQDPNSAQLHALNPSDGTDAWDPQMINTHVWGAPSIANGILATPAGSALNIYNAATGEMLNSFETGGSIAGAPAIVDGKIVVKSGMTYIFDSSAMNNNLVICYGLSGN